MTTLLVILTGIILAADLLLIAFWFINFKSFHPVAPRNHTFAATHPEFLPLPPPALKAYPHVAILLAVRNEAHNLGACLDHLLAQDYPSEKVCIWIGNDASSDSTLTIARSYAGRDTRIKVMDIQENLGEAQAKANVIAHLAQANATSEQPADFILVTDADIRTPPYWIRGMLQSWQSAPAHPKAGIITGVTLVQHQNFWAQLQRIDWLFALGMVKITSDWGVPTATLGNNMMMMRQAYEATGGYESLPFSITEDFQILQQITCKRFGFRNVISQQVAVFTLPIPDFHELMQQRKRWMHGAIRLPWPMVTILFLQALFYPLVIALALVHSQMALFIFAGKILLQSLFIALVIEKIQLRWLQKLSMYACLLPYDVYAAVVTVTTLFYYFLPFKTVWKGRTF